MQTYPHPHQKTQPKSEKDRKTSLNIGKRNEVNDNSTNNNLRNVRTLTNKFDNQVSCSKKISVSENELKQVVNEQTKLISNLQDQLFAKDKKILDLENKLKMLLRNSKLDLSSELNGHSLAWLTFDLSSCLKEHFLKRNKIGRRKRPYENFGFRVHSSIRSFRQVYFLQWNERNG